ATPASDSFPDAGAYDSIQDFDPNSIEKPNPADISDFEVKLRSLHADAMAKLRVRLFEERGDVAAASKYANFLEYRQWQVGVEKQIVSELVAAIQEE
ncbi:UVR8, partial [Symbiodinium pilosum]